MTDGTMAEITLDAMVKEFADLDDSSAGQLADWLQDNPHMATLAMRLLAPRMHEDAWPDERLFKAEFFVHVQSDDYMNLWANHAEEAALRRWDHHDGPRVLWDQDSRGFVVTVGWIAGMPVNLSFLFATLNGHLVCFWEAVSRDRKSVV